MSYQCCYVKVTSDPVVYSDASKYNGISFMTPHGLPIVGDYVVDKYCKGSIYEINKINGPNETTLIDYMAKPIPKEMVEKLKLEKPLQPVPDDGRDGGSRHMQGDVNELIRKGHGRNIPFMTMDEILKKRKHIKMLKKANNF
jgi:hypothetical protein